MSRYIIYFCPTCKNIYAETKRAAQALGFDVVPENYECAICGEYLDKEDSPKTFGRKRRHA